MYSVVLTDVVQFVMIVVGVSITTYSIVAHAGGWIKMVEAAQAHRGASGINLWDSRRFGFLFLSWTTLYYLSGWSSWQPVVARVLSMKDIRTALKLYRLSSIFMFMRAAFPMIWESAPSPSWGVFTNRALFCRSLSRASSRRDGWVW
jgi:Na+/proline symporter